MGVVGVLGDAELGAQLRHARIFHRNARLLLGAGLEGQRRTVGDLHHRAIALAAQFGKLRLQLLVELVRRVVAVEGGGSILGGRDVGQHFGGIGRVLGIENIGRDLRPVHPAALRLTRIVQHAVGQLQFGVGQLVRRGGGSEIRQRIVGGIQAVGSRVLQPRDHALGAGGQLAGLGPQRRVFAGRIELLDRRALGLAVEIAHRLAAEHVAQFVGDRLIGGGDVACSLHRLGGGRCGGCGRGSRRGSRGCGSRRRGRRFGGLCRRRGDDVSRLGRLGGLGRIGHRRGGVDLDVRGRGRRDVGGFGTRDCRIDCELGGAGARGIRLGCQSRGRGNREEGCRDGHQYAVKSSTVGRTVTHRHTPLGETAPAWNSR